MELSTKTISIRANEEMDFATIEFKDSRNSTLMMTHAKLEELKDLLNDYFSYGS